MFKPPSRDQLSKVFPNHELVKAVESLFRDVGQNYPELFAQLTASISSLGQALNDETLNAGALIARLESLAAEQRRARDAMNIALLSPAQITLRPAGDLSPAHAPYIHPNFTL
jgi:hypothetical protein